MTPADPASSNSQQLLAAKALGHPLRARILAELERRPATPKQLSDLLGVELQKVAYHMRVLADLGFAELVRTLEVRGAVAHEYRRTARPIYSNREWSDLPGSLRQALIGELVDVLAGDDAETAAGEPFANELEVYIRQPLHLNRSAWERANEILQDAFQRIAELEPAALTDPEGTDAARLYLMLFTVPSQNDESAPAPPEAERGQVEETP